MSGQHRKRKRSTFTTQKTNGNKEVIRVYPTHLLLRWWLPVWLVLRHGLVLLRRWVSVRSSLVWLLVLRRGCPVVPLLRRSTVCRRRHTVAPGGCVPLLVRWRAATTTGTGTTSIAPAVIVISDHHLDITLGVVRGLSYPGKGDTAGGRVRSGVRLGWDLDAAPRAVLQLFDGRAALADDQAHLALSFKQWNTTVLDVDPTTVSVTHLLSAIHLLAVASTVPGLYFYQCGLHVSCYEPHSLVHPGPASTWLCTGSRSGVEMY